MLCIYRPKVNALWSVWYCVFMTLCMAYLLYLGFMRYPGYLEFSWRDDYPNMALTAYVVLHGAVIGLLIIFIASSIFKVGNLASDNDKLGEWSNKRVWEVSGLGCCKYIRSIWRHAPPVAQTVHLIMTFCILLANTFMETEFFMRGMIKGMDWSFGPLEFLFQAKPLGNMKSTPINKSHFIAARSSAMDQATLGRIQLANFGFYEIPLDFFLHVLGLFIVCVVYPAVFWKASKCFSFIFSLQLFAHAIDAICSYVGFSLMFRLHRIGYIHGMRSKGVHQLLTPEFLLIEYLVTAALSYLCAALVYSYGYGRYCIAVESVKGQPRILKPRCHGYTPNAGAIIALVLLVACRAPLFYDQLMLSQKEETLSKQIKLLICISASVLFLFTWLIIWLALTLRRDWNFHVTPSVFEHYDAKNPDALVVLYNSEVFVTKDPNRRAAILGVVAPATSLGPDDVNVYWLKPDIAATAKSNHIAAASQPPSEYEKYGPSTYEAYRPPSGAKIIQTGFEEQAPQLPPPRTMIPRGSGSYISYTEGDQQQFDRGMLDSANTFGTLPRGTNPRAAMEFHRRARIHQQYQSAQNVPYQGGGPNYANVTYAMVQKRPSPGASGGTQYVYGQAPIAQPEDAAMSRTSSYSNVPAPYYRMDSHQGDSRTTPTSVRNEFIAYGRPAPQVPRGQRSRTLPINESPGSHRRSGRPPNGLVKTGSDRERSQPYEVGGREVHSQSEAIIYDDSADGPTTETTRLLGYQESNAQPYAAPSVHSTKGSRNEYYGRYKNSDPSEDPVGYVAAALRGGPADTGVRSSPQQYVQLDNSSPSSSSRQFYSSDNQNNMDMPGTFNDQGPNQSDLNQGLESNAPVRVNYSTSVV